MRRGRLYFSAAAAAAMCSTPHAQVAPVAEQSAANQPAPVANDSGGLDEIVVTAQKRSESVQKIPLAVTALGGDALLERGTTNLEALSQEVPGLNVSEQVGQARLTLRGIGLDNISTGAESSVAFQPGRHLLLPFCRCAGLVFRCRSSRSSAWAAGHVIRPQRDGRFDQHHHQQADEHARRWNQPDTR